MVKKRLRLKAVFFLFPISFLLAPQGFFPYNSCMRTMEINLVPLSSALSEQKKKEIAAKRETFLGAINARGQFSFVEGKKDDPLTVFYIQTGGSEAPFLETYKDYCEPYYLLATGNSNSLASSLEILSFLQERHLKGEILFGEPEDLAVSLSDLYWAKKAQLALQGRRMGLFGKPSDWLIASSVDFAETQRKFGVTFVTIPFAELKAEVDKKSFDKPAIYPALQKKYPNKEILEGALFIYGALKRLIQKYQLNAFSIRCFELLGTVCNTSCLALALLNAEGVTATCEGDETSLLSMEILRLLSSESVFQCNPATFDLKKETLLLAHCTVPFDMVTSYSLTTHFESGIGIGIKGELRKSRVTLFKMAPSLDRYHLAEGEIVENLSRSDLCRTQIVLKSDDPLEPFFAEPYGNHLLVAYGGLKGRVKRFFSLYNN
jgi:L-fucose isomerase-like protein